MFLDEGSVRFGFECILYVNWNSFSHNRLDSRRIDYLRAEVRKLEGCLVRDVADSTGSRDDLWIRGHHTRHIGPDFEDTGFAAYSVKSCGVVRTSASQSGGPALFVRSDEARKNEKLGDRIGLHHFVHAEISLLDIHYVLVSLCNGADDLS